MAFNKGTNYKTKEVFKHLSYCCYCEKLVCMRCTVTQFARESVGLCPFRGSYVREFELSHSNPVSRITTINHAHSLLDLLQVDLLASRASLVWPRSGRPRATKSREVDLSRLMGFHLHFAPKMGSGVTRIWGFRFHLRVLDFNGRMCWFHSD